MGGRLGGIWILLAFVSIGINGLVVGWTAAHSWLFDLALVGIAIWCWVRHRRIVKHNRGVHDRNEAMMARECEAWAANNRSMLAAIEYNRQTIMRKVAERTHRPHGEPPADMPVWPIPQDLTGYEGYKP